MNISKIATERKKLGLSQEELTSRLKISQKSISKYECGTRRPSYEILLEMSKLFNVSIDYLLGNPTTTDAISKPNHQIGGYDHSINNWIGRTGLSDDEVAQKLGISKELLLDYIQGKSPIPYQILAALSEICEVSTDCLLGIREKSREQNFDNVFPFQYNYQITERI